MDDDDRAIEAFRGAVSKIWAEDGQNTWPIDLTTIAHLFMGPFFEELLEDFDALRRAGFDDGAIAELFEFPARILRMLMPCVQGMREMGLSKAERRDHVLFLLSLADRLKHGDLWNRDGSNLMLSPERLKESLRSVELIPACRESSLLLHRLTGLLWAYEEALWFRVHALAKEFHGPYPIAGKTATVLIRDYSQLNPEELWPECQRIQYDRVRVVGAYESLSFNIDLFNNVSIGSDLGYVNGLRSFAVLADGRSLDPDGCRDLCSELSEAIPATAAWIEKLDWRDLAQRYAGMFWFAKKRLREALGLDWRPPPSVRVRIDAGQPDKRFGRLSPREVQRLLRFTFA